MPIAVRRSSSPALTLSFGMIGFHFPASAARNVPDGCLRLNRTVYLSTASTAPIITRSPRAGEPTLGSRIRSTVYLTSPLSSSLPLWNFTPA